MNYIEAVEPTISSSTISEPSATETAWSGSSVAYVVGDIRIRSTTHRKYKCAVAHTSAASPVPEDDGTRWVDIGPTDKYAPFDEYELTQITATTDITYVFTCRYVNTIYIGGLTGRAVTVSVKDAPAGTVQYTSTRSLLEPARGYWDYAFGVRRPRKAHLFTGIPIYPNAEITVTIADTSTNTRGVGMIDIGSRVDINLSKFGGVEWSPSVTPKTYTYRKINDDGTVKLVPRGSAKDLQCKVITHADDADAIAQIFASLMSKPATFFVTDKPKYRGLMTYGIAEAPTITYLPNRAEVQIKITGYI